MLSPMIDPGTLALVGKLIGLGMAFKKGWGGDVLDDDVSTAGNFLDTGAEVARLWSRGKDARAGALHLALVTRAFGKALVQYWPDVITPALIDRCLTRASLRIADPSQFLPDGKALALLQALSGEPTGNPYYKALWDAFFSAPVELSGGEGRLDLLGENPQLFHAYFRRAYVEALATAEGQQVQCWCLSLAAEKREVMRHILAEDLAAWGTRHVFGNVRHQSPGDPLPFLGLDDSYVEPRGRHEDREAPILGLVRGLLEDHPLVVVRADFGHGKSLTARWLARDAARTWLESRQLAGQSPYPVFIKCSRDLRDVHYDHDAVVRSALWHTAELAVADRPAKHDDAFAPLERDQAALFILDGLDEVALTRNHLEDLFKDLQAALEPGQRALVLTRPGALHHERCLPAGTPVVDLLPLDEDQIAGWIARWNACSGKAPVDVTRLDELGLATLARTPILLLMIAMTWEEHPVSTSQMGKSALYERFFQHIARGKYEHDPDEHRSVREASEHLAEVLIDAGILAQREPVAAMLWLMSRVAWESHTIAYEQADAELDEVDVVSLLKRELGIKGSALAPIELGLLLVMQLDPTGSSKTILFGHQSFREFLVARYWKGQLQRLVARETRSEQRAKIEERLMQARLLHHEDKAFSLLVEMLSGLDPVTRRDIKAWARKYVETDELTLHPEAHTDRRPVLRESALAIGSHIEPDEGLELDEWSLRFLCFWHQFYGKRATIRAPGLRSPHGCLSAVELLEARLPGANLEGADLRGANLERADLRGANLARADLTKANLEETSLAGANLQACSLVFGNVQDANLVGANLTGANLQSCLLAITNLTGANLTGANLTGANLTNTTLIRGNLRACLLVLANLEGANLEGANLEGANLEGANLEGANLKGAALARARVSRRQLASAYAERALGLDAIDEIPAPA
jgi:uncharacterized protein YjbI with pentapeptide repeats